MSHQHLNPEVLRAAAERLAREGPRPWKPKTALDLLHRFNFPDDLRKTVADYMRLWFEDPDEAPMTDQALTDVCKYVDENARQLYDDAVIIDCYKAFAAGRYDYPRILSRGTTGSPRQRPA